MVADTCKYSSGYLIPIFQSGVVAKLGIKGSLEYPQVWATILVSLLFIYMILTVCKIANCPYACNTIHWKYYLLCVNNSINQSLLAKSVEWYA